MIQKERDAMPFPFRWFETLESLTDTELRAMLSAIGRYGQNGNPPDFSGCMAALWNEIKQRIDYDRAHYLEVCQRNQENGKKGAQFGRLGGRPRKTTTGVLKTPTGVSETPKTPKGDAEGDAEASIIKETDVSFSPEPEKSGSPGKPKAEKIFFDYFGDGKLHGITEQQLDLWKENFPAIDVERELKSASAWLDANRKNRKSDVKRFLVAWLNRAQDRAPCISNAPYAPKQKTFNTDAQGNRIWEI